MGGPDGCKSARNQLPDPRLQGRHGQRLADAAAESVSSLSVWQAVSDGVEVKGGSGGEDRRSRSGKEVDKVLLSERRSFA